MRQIPQNIEVRLERLGLTHHERQALYINAERGTRPPNFLSEMIAKRVGADKYLRAWALVTGNKILDQFVQSNLQVRFENFPTAVPVAN